MFYSHEILTSRKYGVATVWLVATLGAKSNNTKKLSRKAILEVNVKKACATIIEPAAPMALRLQSNLLYGVSRVFDQQCGYVLQDAQAAQNALRALIKYSRDNQLDAGAGKAKPEQLLLLDDPTFSADIPLPAFDFDLEFPIISDTRSSQSMMSIRERSGSVSSHASVFGLNIPSSSGNSQYQLPMLDPFGQSPMPKSFGGFGREEEEEFLSNDDLFAFDEDGQLREVSEADRQQLLSGAVSVGHPHSDTGAEVRVQKEHEGGRAVGFDNGEGEFNLAYGEDDQVLLLDDTGPSGDLPVMAGGLGGDDQPQRHSSQDRVVSVEELSSVSAEARQVKAKPKARRKLLFDKRLEVKSSEMKAWHMDYIKNAETSAVIRDRVKAHHHARKNAFHFVIGGGLNGVGNGIGSNKIPSPLAMFAGDSLFALVTGKSISGSAAKKSTKRKAEKDIFPDPKRARDSEQGRTSPSQNGHIIDEEAGFMPMDDGDLSQSIELGRDAASALPDPPSSALMPWNRSASLHSYNRNLSSQHGRSTQFGSGLGAHNRVASASPLIGRGSALQADLDQFMPPEDDDIPMYGRDDDDLSTLGPGYNAGSVRASSLREGPRSRRSESQAAEEFELFGQAANVDTQTAASSQWVRDALDKQSNNFFEYVRNTIEENQDDELAGEEIPRSDDNKRFVTFETLFDPENNTHVVAAQAFYHVLCLATKKRLWVEQDGQEVMEPFGEIRIGITGTF